MEKHQKIASAGSVENLESLLKRFYCSPNIRISEDLRVFNSKGEMYGVKIKTQKVKGLTRYTAYFPGI